MMSNTCFLLDDGTRGRGLPVLVSQRRVVSEGPSLMSSHFKDEMDVR